MKAIDAFGLFAAIVGLLADIIGLSQLTAMANTTPENTTFAWIILFLIIVYSIALISFFARKDSLPI